LNITLEKGSICPQLQVWEHECMKAGVLECGNTSVWR